jgi:riboflavin synthase
VFTGIVTDVGEVVAVEPRAEGLRRLKVACSYPVETIAIGASISHSGVCLTVVETGKLGNRTAVSVDAAAETLRMTTAAGWKQGTRLNLERAMKVGDELGGHIVAVNEVTDETFSVLIIPHTLVVTTLGAAKTGDRMNLEIDLMARYAARLLETR